MGWKFGVEWKRYRMSRRRGGCSDSTPACLSQPVKVKKMSRFPPAYGISTGAPIKQLGSAAPCTYRKQLILIASHQGASDMDPHQWCREDSFTICHTFFFSLQQHAWQQAQTSHSAATKSLRPTGHSPLGVRPPEVTSHPRIRCQEVQLFCG